MSDYFLDNFKLPYLRFEDRFRWPSVHLVDTTDDEIIRIRALLEERWPGFNSDFALWKNDIFSGNQKFLSFVYQPDLLKDSRLMLELRVLIGYAGGARVDEIVRAAEQDRSPEFYTDRIYFRALLLPVESLTLGEGLVRKAEVLTFAEILDASRYSLSREQKEIWTSALFDSIDYSYIQERLIGMLSKLEPWKPGMLFPPVMIERMTFCLNVLSLDQAESMAVPFRDFIGHIQNEDLQMMKSREAWMNYISAWDIERTLSRSGNPHWQFQGYPRSDNPEKPETHTAEQDE